MTETDRRSCKGTKADGSPCGAPGRLVDPDTGYCDAHDPDKRDELRERGRRGGYVSTSPRRTGMDLPPLNSPAAAAVWCEEIARAVADDRISSSRGNTLNKVVKTWLTAHETNAANEAIRRAHESEVFGPRNPDVE